MKKLVLTIAIVLGMTIGASAQYFSDNGQSNGGGLFGYGATRDADNGDGVSAPLLPGHGLNTNQDAETPLGSGALLLIGFGAAYALSKRSKK